MRGALLNILGDIEGLTVLDAFAGSGALAFEAVSRGAVQAVCIERDVAAQRVIAKNITALGLKATVSIVGASVNAWSRTNPTQQFDIVLCDPPYTNLQLSVVTHLVTHTTKGGLLVLSWPSNQSAPELANMQQVDQHDYGDAQLIFYRPLR